MTTRQTAAGEIRSALESASQQQGTYVLYRGTYHEMPVIEVDLATPLFRPENGRLITALQRYLDEQGVDESQFSEQVDENWVQQALWELLLPLSRDPRGSIYDELARQAQQTEPLLMTRDGIVINGNRRLAAMRALYDQDSAQYAAFARVRATVLPKDATAADIEYIEAALQLAPETKLAYTWTNRRLKLRRQRQELDLPVERILESYRLPDKTALKRELRQIDLAEAYLRDYRDMPGEYDGIENAELAFVALDEQLSLLKNKDLTMLWRLAGFTMIEARGRAVKVQDYYPFVPPRPVNVPELALIQLAQSRGLMEEGQRDFESLPVAAMERLLGDPKQARELTQELADILDQLHVEANYHEMPNKLLKHVQSARKLAEKLEAERLTADQKAKIGAELAAMGYHSKRFLNEESDAPAPISQTQRQWRKLRSDPRRFCEDSNHSLLRLIGRHWPGRNTRE